jgi:hypothetical protein
MKCEACTIISNHRLIKRFTCDHLFHEICLGDKEIICPICSFVQKDNQKINKYSNLKTSCSACTSKIENVDDKKIFSCDHIYHKRCLGDNEINCPYCYIYKGFS